MVEKWTDGNGFRNETGKFKENDELSKGGIGTGVITSLAELHPEALVDEGVLAEAFGVSGRTIRRMVNRYELPPPIRVAGRPMWLAGNVTAWLKDKAEQAEKYARAEAERIKRHIP